MTTKAELQDAVNRRLAEHKAEPTNDNLFLLRREVLADMLRYHDRLPLGVCIYPTSKRNFDLVHSFARELDPIVHQLAEGDCTHRVALDDGGLFEVTEDPDNETKLVKVRLLRCHKSTPYQRSNGKWGVLNRYTIPCSGGDFEHERTWEPVGTRHTPDSGDDRAPTDPIGWRLRPLSRADDIAAWYNAEEPGRDDHWTSARPFSAIFSRRNDAESFNEFYQQSLPHHGRANCLDTAGQELDFLLGALLGNTITWANRR